jgi:hypothetical protein
MLDAWLRIRGWGLIVLLLAGVGGVASVGQAARPATIVFGLLPAAPAPPTSADFVGYPSCMIYAASLDTRIRVRAARPSAVCTTLSRQLSSAGVRWSLKPQRLRHILSPICRFADPRGRLELEVVDAAANSARGRRICASLARAGWLTSAGRRTHSRDPRPRRDRHDSLDRRPYTAIAVRIALPDSLWRPRSQFCGSCDADR